MIQPMSFHLLHIHYKYRIIPGSYLKQHAHAAVQSQKAVTAYLKSNQLLSFGFEQKHCLYTDHLDPPPPSYQKAPRVLLHIW